jgi:hypothetical protein
MASPAFPSGIPMVPSAHIPQRLADRSPTQYPLVRRCGHDKEYSNREKRIAIFRPAVRPVASGRRTARQNRGRDPTHSPFALKRGLRLLDPFGERFKHRQCGGRSVRFTLLEIAVGKPHRVGDVGKTKHRLVALARERVEGGSLHLDSQHAFGARCRYGRGGFAERRIGGPARADIGAQARVGEGRIAAATIRGSASAKSAAAA